VLPLSQVTLQAPWPGRRIACMGGNYAAHLAGMGETGVVNLTAHSKSNQLCWKFQLHTMHVLGATVRDKSGMKVANLGHMYRAKGCAMVPKMSLQMIEEKPGHYWVWVATKGHPGELRGKLFAGMAHM